ncbi:MAG: hypothetical protein IT230_09185 [Flavobacteriales bacterium]|nr:hypothetical protein [Flavobacteriales bacterium]
MDFNDPLRYGDEEAFAVMRLPGLPNPDAVVFFCRKCFTSTPAMATATPRTSPC